MYWVWDQRETGDHSRFSAAELRMGLGEIISQEQ